MAYNSFDLPIFQKTYDTYKLIHHYRKDIPKIDRYTLWQKLEDACLQVLEGLLEANTQLGDMKVRSLKHTSQKVDLMRMFVRLAQETKCIDQKKYLALQALLDEIGRMLGGWIKNTR